jgi:uncharacterized membrane protein YcjF (UPF0283 family)
MNDHSALDQRLTVIFRNIDARPGFDERLLARLQSEASADTEERARQARQMEQLRYGVARQELRSWHRWTQAVSRVVTLETIGIGALAISIIASTWSLDQIRQVAPVVITALGILVGLSPVVSPLVLRRK